MTDIALNLLMQAQDGISSVVGGIGSKLASLAGAGPAGIAVAALAGVAVAAIGFGVASVAAAGQYQASMLKVQAYAGLTKTQSDAMSASIMKMSIVVGQSPKALADALYPIVSSGYNAADALNILQLSAKTAAASGAQTSVVADGLTTTLKSFGMQAKQAGFVMDVLNQTTAQGKMEFPALAAVIGRLSLSASSAHIPFVQMNAALATLTTHGFPSVAQASTSLGNLFTQMDVKTDKLGATAKKLGLSFDEQKFKSMSLSQQIDTLSKATNGNQGQMLKLLGGSTVALKAFNALKGGAGDYAQTLDKLQHSSGMTNQVFATASQGMDFQLKRLGAAFDVFKITIGNMLLPIITNLAKAFTPVVAALAQWISSGQASNQISSTMSTIWKAIAPTVSVLGNVLHEVGSFLAATFIPVWQQLVSTFNSQIKPAWSGLMSAIQPIMPELKMFGMLIGGIVVAALVLFAGMLAGTVKALAGLLSGIAIMIGGAVKIFSGGFQVISGIIAFFVDLFTGKFNKLGTDLQTIVGGYVRMFSGLWDVIRGIFTAGVGAVVGLVSGFWSTITGLFTKLADTLVGHSIVPDMITAIVGVFTGLPARAVAGVQSLMSMLSGFFSNLAGQAVQWGVNIIQGFINGIGSMLGAVGSAASNVVGTVKNFLGFHSPAKKGPGADADKWMPNLMLMLTQGLIAGIPALRSGVLGVAGEIGNLSDPLKIYHAGATPHKKAAAHHAATQHKATTAHKATTHHTGAHHATTHHKATHAKSAAPSVDITININIEGRSARTDSDLVNMIIAALSKKLRTSGDLITVTSGGRSH